MLAEAPEVFNHNIETVPRLYSLVTAGRPCTSVLWPCSKGRRSRRQPGQDGLDGRVWGRREEEVHALLDEVAGIGVELVTIGQYLRPSKRQLPVVEYVRPEVFDSYRPLRRGAGS